MESERKWQAGDVLHRVSVDDRVFEVRVWSTGPHSEVWGVSLYEGDTLVDNYAGEREALAALGGVMYALGAKGDHDRMKTLVWSGTEVV